MVADRRELVLSSQEPLRVRTRATGVFLFLPLLVQLGFDALVRQAGYPGTKMVPADAELSKLNARGVFFVTIRRRGAGILKRLEQIPKGDWKAATIDIPKRRHKRIYHLDESIQLEDYEGSLRQIAVTGLGRGQPTLFLTNHPPASPRDMIINYARRNGIEDGLGTNVNFFHMDNLASEVRLNVDLDITLTVIANSCYRWLASRLKGFAHAKPKQLSRKFVETSGHIEVRPNRVLLVTFDRRSHNPILREAALDHDPHPIPWLGGLRLQFDFA